MVLESGCTFWLVIERGPGDVKHFIQSVPRDVTEGDMVEVAGFRDQERPGHVEHALNNHYATMIG